VEPGAGAGLQRVLGSRGKRAAALEVINLTDLPWRNVRGEARRLAVAEAGQGFDLSVGPLLRVKLWKWENRSTCCWVTMHHIVSDGWSAGVLVREFTELYQAEREQREAKLEELEVQYGDYAVWQREWLAGGELKEQMKYWKEQLAGLADAGVAG